MILTISILSFIALLLDILDTIKKEDRFDFNILIAVILVLSCWYLSVVLGIVVLSIVIVFGVIAGLLNL